MRTRWAIWAVWATRITGLVMVAVGTINWVSVFAERFTTSSPIISTFTAQKTLTQYYMQLTHWILFVMLGLAILVMGWRIKVGRPDAEASPSAIQRFTS